MLAHPAHQRQTGRRLGETFQAEAKATSIAVHRPAEFAAKSSGIGGNTSMPRAPRNNPETGTRTIATARVLIQGEIRAACANRACHGQGKRFQPSGGSATAAPATAETHAIAASVMAQITSAVCPVISPDPLSKPLVLRLPLEACGTKSRWRLRRHPCLLYFRPPDFQGGDSTMATKAKSGGTVRVTISKTITRDSARKTIERLFMMDKGVAKPVELRSRNFKELPKRRGGVIWTKRPNKVHPGLVKGTAATIKATPQHMRDLKSVMEFVSVAGA
jgi:hypothetical protein